MSIKSQPSLIVPVNSLDYARGKFDARVGNEDPESEEMKELISSIKTYGIKHALEIRPKSGGRYDVIAGNRRLTAAKALKLQYVPAEIVEYTPVKALLWAFSDNRKRKNYSQLESAKILLRCYNAVGLDGKIAIRKVKFMYNLKQRDPDEYAKFALRTPHRITERGNAAKDETEPTPEFLEVFFDVDIAPNTQYQLLQIVTQIDDSAFKIIEQHPKISLPKAVALTHSELRKLPEDVRKPIMQSLAEQIVSPNINESQARHLVNQTIDDLKTGRTTVTEDGNISYGYGSGKGYRSDPEENVDTKQDLERPFNLEIIQINIALRKAIGQILHTQVPKGATGFNPELYKPKLEELKQNLKTLSNESKIFVATDAAIMFRICKAIVDSVH